MYELSGNVPIGTYENVPEITSELNSEVERYTRGGEDIKQHKNALNASKLTFDANLVGNGTQLFLAVFRTVLSHFQGCS